jgi:hypothetical protein
MGIDDKQKILKEEYKLKIDRMFELISLMKEKVITFGQLNEFIDTIKELSILTGIQKKKAKIIHA